MDQNVTKYRFGIEMKKKNGIGSDRINKDEGDEVPPLCQCNFCEKPKGRSS